METLTPTEERIMQIIWKLGKCLVRDVMAQLPEPDPRYSTVSSVVRILEKKGFVGHKAYGRTYEYFPLISLEAYRKFSFGRLLSDYFDDSYEQVVSFLVKEESLSKSEINELLEAIDQDEKQSGSTPQE